MSIDDQTLPQPQEASEKKPNASINHWPPVDFSAPAPTVPPIGKISFGPPDESLAPRLPCRIVIRQPTGTRHRGMRCLTCGTEVNEGQELVCTK